MIFSNNWFDFLKVTLASSDQIRTWGTHLNGGVLISGSIKTTELISGELLRPASTGLFCEKIFGSIDNNYCLCGKFFGLKFVFCSVCGLSQFSADVRRARMGFIELCLPVSHIWYVSGISSFLSILLNFNSKIISDIIYLTHVDSSALLDSIASLDSFFYDVASGALLLKRLLNNLNLNLELLRCRLLLFLVVLGYAPKVSKFKTNFLMLETRERLLKRIRLLENFIFTKSHPRYLMLDLIPVLPPNLRPLLLDSKKLLVSDINKLYLNILTANSRLSRSLKDSVPAIVIANEYRFLQNSVDLLIDNNAISLSNSKVHTSSLLSLSTNLRGKFGRFRYNLLGKRVNSSGRSVIAVGPFLKLNQCGLPLKIAIKLFEPFLINQLLRLKLTSNISGAYSFLHTESYIICVLLNKLFKHHLVFLNRAPTLHRLGLQAFEPILVLGDALLFPALLCSSFNADFDGDQMSVYLPFTKNSQRELRKFLYTPQNLISGTTGSPNVIPSHEMIIGSTYLTLINSTTCENYYNNFYEVLCAFINHFITLQTLIWIKFNSVVLDTDNVMHQQFKLKVFNLHPYILTSMGRLLVNKAVSTNLYI